MNRQQRRAARRKLRDVIWARIGQDYEGNYNWFERRGDQPKPETIVYGRFATEAECNESQRLVLLGPQCELKEAACGIRHGTGEEQ
jgi:hypothetical protein